MIALRPQPAGAAWPTFSTMMTTAIPAATTIANEGGYEGPVLCGHLARHDKVQDF